MSDLVWWSIFSLLTIILTVMTLKFLYRVINDVWCKDDNVYSDEQKDIEDLTRYRTDFRTIFKDAQVRDESDRLMMRKEFINAFRSENEMRVIEEEDESKLESKKIQEEKEEVKESHVVEEQEKEAPKQDSEGQEKEKDDQKKDQVDAVEEDGLTEEEKSILEKIQGIEGETEIYAKQIPFCLGGKNHLTYFEFNDKFLRNLIGLSAIDCKENNKLKRRKELVSLYIQECQNQLKARAEASI